MGEVFEAVHQLTQRKAAVKVLYPGTQNNRFRNEAFIQSSIRHEHIVVLYEYAEVENSACIIMEYVDGILLEKLIKRQGRLPENYVWKIMSQISEAVAYLHERNIIHRDLKPGNIKINRESVSKLLDFGIAKSTYSPRLTKEGYLVGTSYYMAPEQFSGKVSIESDCWSLGVLMYEMLTGCLPFEGGSDTEIRHKIEKGEYPPPNILAPNLSKYSRNLIAKMLRINPSARITAKELYHTLQNPGTNAGLNIPDTWNYWIKKITHTPINKWFTKKIIL